MTQADFFEAPRFDPLHALLARPGKPATIVIGCGQRKRTTRAPARELYTSKRFRMACAAAEALSAPYFIMSGLHGLVRPDEVLDPYDADISVYEPGQRVEWGKKVLSALRAQKKTERICILSSSAYSDPVLQVSGALKKLPPIIAPLSDVEVAHHDAWHAQALEESQRYADEVSDHTNAAGMRRFRLI